MKEKCKEWALQWKEKTGKFPNKDNWLKKQNNSPLNKATLTKLFNGYNNFRKYCNEPEVRRLGKITLEWIKQNCIIDENGCWVWNKACCKDGYGICNSNKVHRIAYELVNGKIPEGLIIRHKCDNKPCCNPEHLEIGTKQDNALDVVKRNTNKRSSGNVELKKIVEKITSLEDRIKFYLDNTVITNNECLESSIRVYNKQGYLLITFNSKPYRLHRLIVAQNENLDYNDKSWVARHLCNNKRCINPEHLKSGTQRHNNLDSRKYSKNTKLTKEQVVEIKTDWKNNSSSYKYKTDFDEFWADKYNVSKSCIINIRSNKKWKDIIIL